MQISSRFTIASHILTLLALEGQTEKLTSQAIAGSVGVNPVVVRNILGQLKQAGLVHVARGVGGATLAKDVRDVTLLDIYQAVESLGQSGQLFGFHEHPNPACQVGKNIHHLLDDELERAQAALENELAQTKLSDLLEKMDSLS